MREIGSTLFRKPIALLLFGLSTAVFCFTEYIFLGIVFTLFRSLNAGSFIVSYISFLQHVINSLTNRTGLILPYLFIGILGCMLWMGIIFSGFFHTINNTLSGKRGERWEFFQGIRSYFGKVALRSFLIIVLAGGFMYIILVIGVPAMIISRAAINGKPNLIPAAVIFDILTVAVVFFSMMFFRIYILFWYPAIFNSRKRFFWTGKKLVDSGYWGLVKMLLKFDLVFILPQAAVMFFIYQTSSIDGFSWMKMSVFLGNWGFKTLFFASLFTAVFLKYKSLDAKQQGRAFRDAVEDYLAK